MSCLNPHSSLLLMKDSSNGSGVDNLGLIAIEENGHILETPATGLGIEKVISDAIKGTDDNEYEIVFPADGRQCNGIDKGVEENR